MYLNLFAHTASFRVWGQSVMLFMANTQVYTDWLMFIKIYDELNHVLIKKEM